MKHIIFLAAALLFAGCNTAHKAHDHGAEAGHEHGGEECGCAEGSGHHEHGEKHDHKHGAEAAAATPTAPAWNLSGNPQLKAEISEADFVKAYVDKHTQFGKKCSAAASEYCGKTSKDLAVTQEEVACLWSKAHRVTRETLSQLDKTPCEKLLKNMAPKKK